MPAPTAAIFSPSTKISPGNRALEVTISAFLIRRGIVVNSVEVE
jgi:hypothetical protein